MLNDVRTLDTDLYYVWTLLSIVNPTTAGWWWCHGHVRKNQNTERILRELYNIIIIRFYIIDDLLNKYFNTKIINIVKTKKYKSKS